MVHFCISSPLYGAALKQYSFFFECAPLAPRAPAADEVGVGGTGIWGEGPPRAGSVRWRRDKRLERHCLVTCEGGTKSGVQKKHHSVNKTSLHTV